MTRSNPVQKKSVGSFIFVDFTDDSSYCLSANNFTGHILISLGSDVLTIEKTPGEKRKHFNPLFSILLKT